MKLIECVDLKIGYNHHPISTVNLEINRGDFICIIGNNGSGKSTLIKTILKFIPPVSGRVLYDYEIKNASIGYLQQDLHVSEDFPATVYEIVLSGCIGQMGNRLFFSKKEKETANKYLEYLGIAHLKNKPYKKLSGGEQQRTLIARALCGTGDILFLDEPLQGLDKKASIALYNMLDKINKEANVTIVMITHNVEIALNHVNKIVLMDTIPFIGTPEEYKNSPHMETYKGGDDHA